MPTASFSATMSSSGHAAGISLRSLEIEAVFDIGRINRPVAPDRSCSAGSR
jgi:hypothetical protein